MLTLDNSGKSCFLQCPRKYFYSFISCLDTEKGSTALRYGSTYHAMKEGFLTYVIENGWDIPNAIAQGASYGKETWDEETEGREFIDDYRTFENCLNSFLAGINNYPLDKTTMKIIASEQLFNHKIILTNSQRKQFPYLASLIFNGKIDALVELSGSPWILEFKTTGQSLSMQTQRLYRSSQLLGYSYIGRNSIEFPSIGVLVDFHQISSRIKKDGTYGKLTINFERVPQIFTDKDIEAWFEDFLFTANNIEICKRHSLWPQNTDNCFNYGPCKYLPLCERNLPLNTDLNEIPGYIIREKHYLDERKNKGEKQNEKCKRCHS